MLVTRRAQRKVSIGLDERPEELLCRRKKQGFSRRALSYDSRAAHHIPRRGLDSNHSVLSRKFATRTRPPRVTFGEASAQGIRDSMEDASINALLQLSSMACVKQTSSQRVHFYAVLDGHGGCETSEFLSKNLVSYIEKHLNNETTVETALEKAFLEANEEAMKHHVKSGSTCVGILIEEATNTAWVCNVGDSRCVFNNGFTTVDHKPSRQDEMERIELEGGYIINNRVMGLLAVTRAFGDQLFRPAVTCLPEITKIELDTSHEFAILACDGLWDVLSNDLVSALVSDGLTIKAPIEDISWSLVHSAINERNSTDNVSVLVLQFH